VVNTPKIAIKSYPKSNPMNRFMSWLSKMIMLSLTTLPRRYSRSRAKKNRLIRPRARPDRKTAKPILMVIIPAIKQKELENQICLSKVERG